MTMNDTVDRWFSVLCLVLIAVVISAVLVAIFFRILDANEVSKPAEDADDLETNPKDTLGDDAKKWLDDKPWHFKPSPASQQKTWVAEIILPKGEGKAPCYYFHCPAYDANGKPGIYQGKCYLYTPTGMGFVTTENPTTAILLQQLLNEGQLTVHPFNPETNDLSK